MAAYLIVNVEITDPVKYAEYIKVAPLSIRKFGGKYLARGGRAETIEGTWSPKRLVVLEFPSFERAREWWDSDDYRGPRALRQASAITQMMLVEGIDAQP